MPSGEAVRDAGPAAGSKIKTTDGGDRMKSTTSLSRSATEFDLECETDSCYEKSAKRVDRAGGVTTVVSSTADLMSGGVLLASSLSGTGDEPAVIGTVTSVGTDDVLPQLKRSRIHNVKASKVSNIVFVYSL